MIRVKINLVLAAFFLASAFSQASAAATPFAYTVGSDWTTSDLENTLVWMPVNINQSFPLNVTVYALEDMTNVQVELVKDGVVFSTPSAAVQYIGSMTTGEEKSVYWNLSLPVETDAKFHVEISALNATGSPFTDQTSVFPLNSTTSVVCGFSSEQSVDNISVLRGEILTLNLSIRHPNLVPYEGLSPQLHVVSQNHHYTVNMTYTSFSVYQANYSFSSSETDQNFTYYVDMTHEGNNVSCKKTKSYTTYRVRRTGQAYALRLSNFSVQNKSINNATVRSFFDLSDYGVSSSRLVGVGFGVVNVSPAGDVEVVLRNRTHTMATLTVSVDSAGYYSVYLPRNVSEYYLGWDYNLSLRRLSGDFNFSVDADGDIDSALVVPDALYTGWGIGDVLEQGSWWLRQDGAKRTRRPHLSLETSFLQVYASQREDNARGAPYELGVGNLSTTMFLMDVTRSLGNNWKINGSNFGEVYGSDNQTVYYYDWESSVFKVWQEGVNNQTHGSPPFNDIRYRQAFIWRYRFAKSGYPEINLSAYITMHDPFVRIMLDANNTTGSWNLLAPIKLPNQKGFVDFYANSAWQGSVNGNISSCGSIVFDSTGYHCGASSQSWALEKNTLSFLDYPKKSPVLFLSVSRGFGNGFSGRSLSLKDSDGNGKLDLVSLNLSHSPSEPLAFTFSLGFSSKIPTYYVYDDSFSYNSGQANQTQWVNGSTNRFVQEINVGGYPLLFSLGKINVSINVSTGGWTNYSYFGSGSSYTSWVNGSSRNFTQWLDLSSFLSPGEAYVLKKLRVELDYASNQTGLGVNVSARLFNSSGALLGSTPNLSISSSGTFTLTFTTRPVVENGPGRDAYVVLWVYPSTGQNYSAARIRLDASNNTLNLNGSVVLSRDLAFSYRGTRMAPVNLSMRIVNVSNNALLASSQQISVFTPGTHELSLGSLVELKNYSGVADYYANLSVSTSPRGSNWAAAAVFLDSSDDALDYNGSYYYYAGGDLAFTYDGETGNLSDLANSSNMRLGFDNRSLEETGNSTQTFYWIKDWRFSRQNKNHSVDLLFDYDDSYVDDFGVGQYALFGLRTYSEPRNFSFYSNRSKTIPINMVSAFSPNISFVSQIAFAEEYFNYTEALGSFNLTLPKTADYGFGVHCKGSSSINMRKGAWNTTFGNIECGNYWSSDSTVSLLEKRFDAGSNLFFEIMNLSGFMFRELVVYEKLNQSIRLTRLEKISLNFTVHRPSVEVLASRLGIELSLFHYNQSMLNYTSDAFNVNYTLQPYPEPEKLSSHEVFSPSNHSYFNGTFSSAGGTRFEQEIRVSDFGFPRAQLSALRLNFSAVSANTVARFSLGSSQYAYSEDFNASNGSRVFFVPPLLLTGSQAATMSLSVLSGGLNMSRDSSSEAVNRLNGGGVSYDFYVDYVLGTPRILDYGLGDENESFWLNGWGEEEARGAYVNISSEFLDIFEGGSAYSPNQLVLGPAAVSTWKTFVLDEWRLDDVPFRNIYPDQSDRSSEFFDQNTLKWCSWSSDSDDFEFAAFVDVGNASSENESGLWVSGDSVTLSDCNGLDDDCRGVRNGAYGFVVKLPHKSSLVKLVFRTGYGGETPPGRRWNLVVNGEQRAQYVDSILNSNKVFSAYLSEPSDTINISVEDYPDGATRGGMVHWIGVLAKASSKPEFEDSVVKQTLKNRWVFDYLGGAENLLQNPGFDSSSNWVKYSFENENVSIQLPGYRDSYLGASANLVVLPNASSSVERGGVSQTADFERRKDKWLYASVLAKCVSGDCSSSGLRLNLSLFNSSTGAGSCEADFSASSSGSLESRAFSEDAGDNWTRLFLYCFSPEADSAVFSAYVYNPSSATSLYFDEASLRVLDSEPVPRIVVELLSNAHDPYSRVSLAAFSPVENARNLSVRLRPYLSRRYVDFYVDKYRGRGCFDGGDSSCCSSMVFDEEGYVCNQKNPFAYNISKNLVVLHNSTSNDAPLFLALSKRFGKGFENRTLGFLRTGAGVGMVDVNYSHNFSNALFDYFSLGHASSQSTSYAVSQNSSPYSFSYASSAVSESALVNYSASTVGQELNVMVGESLTLTSVAVSVNYYSNQSGLGVVLSATLRNMGGGVLRSTDTVTILSSSTYLLNFSSPIALSSSGINDAYVLFSVTPQVSGSNWSALSFDSDESNNTRNWRGAQVFNRDFLVTYLGNRSKTLADAADFVLGYSNESLEAVANLSQTSYFVRNWSFDDAGNTHGVGLVFSYNESGVDEYGVGEERVFGAKNASLVSGGSFLVNRSFGYGMFSVSGSLVNFSSNSLFTANRGFVPEKNWVAVLELPAGDYGAYLNCRGGGIVRAFWGNKSLGVFELNYSEYFSETFLGRFSSNQAKNLSLVFSEANGLYCGAVSLYSSVSGEFSLDKQPGLVFRRWLLLEDWTRGEWALNATYSDGYGNTGYGEFNFSLPRYEDSRVLILTRDSSGRSVDANVSFKSFSGAFSRNVSTKNGMYLLHAPFDPRGTSYSASAVSRYGSKSLSGTSFSPRLLLDFEIPVQQKVLKVLVKTGGSPLPGAVVSLVSADGETFTKTTGVSGAVTHTVSYGEYELVVSKRGYLSRMMLLEASSPYSQLNVSLPVESETTVVNQDELNVLREGLIAGRPVLLTINTSSQLLTSFRITESRGLNPFNPRARNNLTVKGNGSVSIVLVPTRSFEHVEIALNNSVSNETLYIWVKNYTRVGLYEEVLGDQVLWDAYDTSLAVLNSLVTVFGKLVDAY